MSTTTQVEETAAPTGGKKKLVVAVVALAAVGAAAWYFLLGGPAEASDAPPVDGEIVALEPQTTTLGRDGIHARVALAVVLAEGTDPVVVTERAPLLQDALLRELATMDASTVRSAEGSDQLRAHLTEEAHGIWDEEAVRRVVLTELMVQ